MDTIICHNDQRSVNSFNTNLKRGDINPLLRKSYKQLININSRFRNNYTTTPASNYGFNLSTPVKKVVSMKVADIVLPKIIYTVSSKLGSNNFKISYVATDISNIIIIPNGSYSAVDMVTQMNVTLSQAGFSNITLSYNRISGIMSFDASNSQVFALDFTYNNRSNTCSPFSQIGTNLYKDQLTLGWLLGFRKNYKFNTPLTTYDIISYVYTNAYSYIAESLYDSHGSRYFLLSVNDYNNNHNISLVSPLQYETLGDGNIIAKISSECCNCCTTEPVERIYFGPTDISKLHIILYDEFGRIVDFNNGDYSLTLELEILYDL